LNILIKSLRSFLNSRKLILVNSNSFMRPWDLCAKLAAQGHHIEVVYDIGAHDGSWTKLLKSRTRNMKFYLFEPNSIYNPQLLSSGEEFFNVLFSSKAENIDFYSLGKTSDSLFKPIGELYGGVKPTTMASKTLDDFSIMNKLQPPDVIKFDTQGSELEIMRGGINTIKQAKALIVEVSLLSSNIGGCKIGDVIDFLETLSFFPIAVLDLHLDDRRYLHQIDLIFIQEKLRINN